jgi:ABC-2 type transport system permease protein
VEYLLDDNGLIEARNREIKMRLLDKAIINDQKSLWQIVNIALPLALLGIYGIVFNRRRKRKFAVK